MKYQIFKISQNIRGWINYFGITSGYQRCVELDHWIRRRVRMAYWRQWRSPRTNVRNLMKLGVQVRAAVACGITSKVPWRSSKTQGIQQALSNAYLKSKGRDGWVKLHHPKLNALCGAACRVLWGLRVRDPRLPDYVLI